MAFALLFTCALQRVGAASLRATHTHGGAAGWFAYDYHTHGQDWQAGQCGGRQRQSPVDFPRGIPQRPTGGLTYKYEVLSTPFEFFNNGHAYSAEVAGLGYGGVTYQNAWYNLLNVNIHAFSEHTFGGVHYPLELHLVHKRYDSDALLIVAVPISCSTIPPSLLQVNATRRVRTGQGERGVAEQARCQAPAPGPAPGPAPAMPCAQPVGYEGYTPPPILQLNFNPQLQKFLAVEPPPVNTKTVVPLLPLDPLDLNAFLDGGNFYEYAGSTTAPPCAEIVTWMVRSEPVMAADMQIAYLVDGIFRMTAFYGNYRSVMPLNGRSIILREAIRESPPPQAEGPKSSASVRTDREYRAMKWAKDALKIAKSSVDYVQDLDQRLRSAAAVRAAVLDQPLGPPQTTPFPSTTPPPYDLAKTAAAMAASIAEAAKEVVKQAIEEMTAQAKTAAMEAAKKAAMTVATGSYSLLPATPPPQPMMAVPQQMYRR